MKYSLYLPVFESNFLEDNRDLLPGLLRGNANMRHVATICDNFRRSAIASLLQSGKASVFRLRLQRSARAWVTYLGYAAETEKRISWSLPLFDGIGAGDYDSAMEIANLSFHKWVDNEEYEEDFLYYEFIMQHSLLNTSKSITSNLLKQWQACLGDSDDLRLLVCRALFDKDELVFNEALRSLLEERRQEYVDKLDMYEPEVLATEASVSVEGLALLRLADRIGMILNDEFYSVPTIARTDVPIAWEKDSFMNFS